MIPAPPTNIWVSCGVILAFGLGLLLPFASLPFFALGQWEMAQPLIIGLHLSIGITALTLACWARTDTHTILHALVHPFAAIPLVLGILSAIFSVVSDLPLTSILGTVQSGQGALWFMGLGLMTALAALIKHDNRFKKWIIPAALSCGAVVALLKGWDLYLVNAKEATLLLPVASYYSWLAFPLIVFLPEKLSRSHLQHLVIILVVITLALTSKSLTAMIGATLGLGLFYLSKTLLLRIQSTHMLRIGAALLASILLLGPVLSAIYSPTVRSISTINERYSILLMLFQDTSQWSIGDWLTGAGWGNVSNAFQVNLSFGEQTFWDNSWTLMESDYFHAHNGVIEALYSGGIITAALFFVYMVIPPLIVARDKLPHAIGFTIMHASLMGLWFPLAFSVPVTALALGFLTQPSKNQETKDFKWVRGNFIFIKTAFLFIAVIFMSAAFFEFKEAQTQEHIKVAHKQAWIPVLPCPDSLRGDDLALASMFRDTLNSYSTIKDEKKVAERIPVVSSILRCLEQRIPTTRTPLLAVTGLSAMAQIYQVGTLNWAAEEQGPTAWESWLDHALSIMPKRTDLAISFLTKELEAGNLHLVKNYADEFLKRNDQDPIGWYFLGLVHALNGNSKMGSGFLTKSIQYGLDRFMPIDKRIQKYISDNSE